MWKACLFNTQVRTLLASCIITSTRCILTATMHYPFIHLLLASCFFSSAFASSSNTRFIRPRSYNEQHVPDAVAAAALRNHNTSTETIRLLSPRQANSGRCGTDYANQVCAGIQCCSSYGYCGLEFEYCGVIVGCQPQFGRCGDVPSSTFTTVTPSSTPVPSSSTMFSTSSSSILPPTSSSALPPLPSSTLTPSTNGQCGNVTTCAGSTFGNCCSEYYFCGDELAFCGEGCRVGFGRCGVVPGLSSSSSLYSSSSFSSSSSSTFGPSSSSTTIPTSTPSTTGTTSTSISTSTRTPSPTSSTAPIPTNVSTAGRCGADGNGQTCTGSRFGKCCSSYGWCGDDANDYCRVLWGCQVQFGICTS